MTRSESANLRRLSEKVSASRERQIKSRIVRTEREGGSKSRQNGVDWLKNRPSFQKGTEHVNSTANDGFGLSVTSRSEEKLGAVYVSSKAVAHGKYISVPN